MKTFYAIHQPIQIKTPTNHTGVLCSFNKKASRDRFVRLGAKAGEISQAEVSHETHTILKISSKDAAKYISTSDYECVEA